MNARPSYINHTAIEYYYEQFEIRKHIKVSYKEIIKNLLAGKKLSQQIKASEKELSITKKIELLCSYLNNNALLGSSRPNTVAESEASEFNFIFEDVVAHKLVFEKDKTVNIAGVNQLVVWIADPDIKQLSEDPYIFSGTFLILIEVLYDGEGFGNNLSGCSALQSLANTLDGKPFLAVNWDEPLGRCNSEHPVEKLKGIGAKYLKKQRIRTIYKKLYMSDEQAFVLNGKEYRCNDMIVYPLFIV